MLHKAEHPQQRSEDMAKHFTAKLGRVLTAANVRQLLHRGLETLNDLLVGEVARSLTNHHGDAVNADQVEEELLNLNLLDKHRRDAVNRFRRQRER
jgi:hypothetical protein